MDFLCIFPKIVHDRTGEELEIAYLDEGTYVESIELDGPKLMLAFRDPMDRIKNDLQVREFDTLTVSFCDLWRENGVNERDVFTILTCKPDQDGKIRMNLMAKTVYGMKVIADKTKIFTQRGLSDILGTWSNGAKLNLGKFPVVENYHCIAGERPSNMLRQIALEQGAHLWYARGSIHMKRFAEMFSQEPALTFHWGTMKHENGIVKYEKPSGQLVAQENNVRTFTGWNEIRGRVKTSPDMPVLAKAGSKPTTITNSPNTFILGNAPVAKKTAIDFISLGNMSITAGQAVKLIWHTADPSNPVDEGLPDKVVVESVAHWYSNQKYYSRVKGAIALEPF